MDSPDLTVTLNAGDGTINSGNVTSYTYGVGTLPTDVTRTGYTFKGWYDNENLTGSPVTAIGDTETGTRNIGRSGKSINIPSQ
ncbi:MAG: InlB B-repeat-containing protein [Coprococcus sp.]